MKEEIIFRSDNYWQGVLQIRPAKEVLLEFVRNQLTKMKGCEITKMAITKNGYDLYLTSQKGVQLLGNKLKKSFPGTLKKSRLLHGRNRLTSKNIYRVTVCFRLDE